MTLLYPESGAVHAGGPLGVPAARLRCSEVVAAGARHTFDSFECAIHLLAPTCEHCGCKVIAHGSEVDGRFFCCAHCARHGSATEEVQDRVDTKV